MKATKESKEKKFRKLTDEEMKQVTGGKTDRQDGREPVCNNYDEIQGICLD